jgi:hypothetical protein
VFGLRPVRASDTGLECVRVVERDDGRDGPVAVQELQRRETVADGALQVRAVSQHIHDHRTPG